MSSGMWATLATTEIVFQPTILYTNQSLWMPSDADVYCLEDALDMILIHIVICIYMIKSIFLIKFMSTIIII